MSAFPTICIIIALIIFAFIISVIFPILYIKFGWFKKIIMIFYIGMSQMILLHSMMDAQCIVNANIVESILCKIVKEIGLNGEEG